MKHLKTYILFESVEDDDTIKQTIKDMSLDIQDDGLNVNVTGFSIHGERNSKGNTYISITRGKSDLQLSDEAFKSNNELVNFLTRLQTYMDENKLKIYSIRYEYIDYGQDMFSDSDNDSIWTEDSATHINNLIRDIEGLELGYIKIYYKGNNH